MLPIRGLGNEYQNPTSGDLPALLGVCREATD